jgi:hypothetical protein
VCLNPFGANSFGLPGLANLPIARESIQSRRELRSGAGDAVSRFAREKGDDPGLRCLSFPVDESPCSVETRIQPPGTCALKSVSSTSFIHFSDFGDLTSVAGLKSRGELNAPSTYCFQNMLPGIILSFAVPISTMVFIFRMAFSPFSSGFGVNDNFFSFKE